MFSAFETDRILCFGGGEKLVIAGVFEAKAGKHAARELSFARESFSGLTKEELAELRANAKDVVPEQRAAAKAARRPDTAAHEVDQLAVGDHATCGRSTNRMIGAR